MGSPFEAQSLVRPDGDWKDLFVAFLYLRHSYTARKDQGLPFGASAAKANANANIRSAEKVFILSSRLRDGHRRREYRCYSGGWTQNSRQVAFLDRAASPEMGGIGREL